MDLVSEVNVANVSLNHGMSGRSLCNGSDICELVRASHNWLSSAEVGWLCGLWCPDSDILHLGLHPIDVGFVGIVNPFLGSLSDFVLYLPLG